jgi:hypothetical protein
MRTSTQINFISLGYKPRDRKRCRALEQNFMSKTDDPLAMRVHRKNAERMLLHSFVSGVAGTPSRQVEYANLQTLGEALKIAHSVQEAEKQERYENIYTNYDESVHTSSRSSSPARSENGSQRNSDVHAVNYTRNRRNATYKSVENSAKHGTKNDQGCATLL